MGGELRLSKSKVNSYFTCPFKYHLSYNLSIWPLKKAINLVTGLVTHKLIEVYLRRKEEGKPFSLTETHGGVWQQYPEKQVECDESKEYQESVELSLALANLFMTKLDTRPCLVEHSFALPVIDPVTGEVAEGILWVGIMDHVNCREDGDIVVDIKTKAKKGQQFDARVAFELTGYSYAYRMLTERQEHGVALVNLIKTKEPCLQQLEDYRDHEDIQEFFHTLVGVSNGIQGGSFYRNPGFHCGYCDYKPVCARDMDRVVEKFGEEAYEKIMAV